MASVISNNDKNVLHMILNPNLPLDDNDGTEIVSSDPDDAFDAEKLEQVKQLEKDGVKHAEAKQFDESLGCFDKAIDILPQRPSGYNNRAQSKRLNGDIQGALDDLNLAITLSNEKGKVASLAFAQRALIMKFNGDTQAYADDLKKAADLGNSFAKQELVQSNPYAALCNKMLAQVMGEFKSGGNKE